MPDSTPIYGFTYPCPGETVDAADIALLAGQIDTKLADANADKTAALLRKNTDLPIAVQTITAGVDTVFTTTYTIPAAGVWFISVDLNRDVSPPTATGYRGSVRQNGVVRFRFTNNPEGGNTQMNVHPKGPMVCAVGDVISLQWLYSGTGTMDVSGRLSAKLVCRIP